MNAVSFMLLAKFMLTYLPWVRARRFLASPCLVAQALA